MPGLHADAGFALRKVVADLEKQLQELRCRLWDERSAVCGLVATNRSRCGNRLQRRAAPKATNYSNPAHAAQEARKNRCDQLQETLQQWQKSAIDLQGEIQSLGDGVFKSQRT
jgi:hypothetical protein